MILTNLKQIVYRKNILLLKHEYLLRRATQFSGRQGLSHAGIHLLGAELSSHTNNDEAFIIMKI